LTLARLVLKKYHARRRRACRELIDARVLRTAHEGVLFCFERHILRAIHALGETHPRLTLRPFRHDDAKRQRVFATRQHALGMTGQLGDDRFVEGWITLERPGLGFEVERRTERTKRRVRRVACAAVFVKVRVERRREHLTPHVESFA